MAVRQTKSGYYKSRPMPYQAKGHHKPIAEDMSKKHSADDAKTGSASEEASDVKSYPCISARQPYAGLILNGYKTLETRWTPMFKELENQTVAIHIAQRTWEGLEWKEALHLRGLSKMQIDCMVSEAEKHGRGVIAGLVDIGETWQCLTDECDESERTQWETEALLKPLEEKYLTKLNNPRWLKRPIRSRGHKGVWTVWIQQEDL